MANARSARLLSVLALSATCAGPSRADDAGERETRALQACLFDYQDAEHQYFEVPYYTCMGEQLGIAANPTLERERCLFKELAAWTNLIEDACEDLGEIIEPGSETWDALCFEYNAPSWSYIILGLNRSDRALDARQTIL